MRADKSGTPSVTLTGGLSDPETERACLGRYLVTSLGDHRWHDCDIDYVAGGKSNLTFRITCAAGTLALRRPPYTQVLPTAHDMIREWTVLSALKKTDVPAPAARSLCRDRRVLGCVFYLMDWVPGHVIRDGLPAGYADAPAERRALSMELVDTLARIHAVDYRAVGLESFGRPEGFLDRQVQRWTRQWETSDAGEHPGFHQLAASLRRAVPPSSSVTLLHGDYRLDNTVYRSSPVGAIAAVLDWELSTLGDPIADLGMLLAYWTTADDPEVRRHASVAPSVTGLPGFPDRVELVERYAAIHDASAASLPWYLAFSFFKLASVCAGISARHRAGAMVDDQTGIEQKIDPLIELGRATPNHGVLH